MRQVFRRYAFPMMIIAAVLAAALPLNSFALDLSTFTLTDDFAIKALGLSSWTYHYNLTNSVIVYDTFSSSCQISTVSSVYFPVLSRIAYFNSNNTDLRQYRFDLPIFLKDIYSIDFDLFFSCINSSGSIVSGTDFTSVILHTDSSSIDLSSSVTSGFYIFNNINTNITDMPSRSSINCYSLSYSSTSSFDADYISFYFYVDQSIIRKYYTIFGINPNITVSTLSSNVSSIMEGQELIVRLLDTSIAQDASNNAVIVDRLDQILAAVEAGGSGGSGSDPGTGEGEEILQEGAIKQEQLEQLGDALSNVPKPSIENITQTFDPADTLISADPGMIQNALSIVYSWDKFLILLGLFIAVGTISYIIFGKKS